MTLDATWIETLVGGVIGFGAGVFAEPCREFFIHPEIKFQSGPYKGCSIDTMEHFSVPPGTISIAPPHEALYSRVRLVNTGKAVARGVRVFLVGIDIHHRDGGWMDTGFADTLMLPWSCRGARKFDAIDLPRGVPHFADLMSSREPQPDMLRMEVDGWPMRYANLIARGSVYRMNVIATGDNFDPVESNVVLTWNGTWKDLRTTSTSDA